MILLKMQQIIDTKYKPNSPIVIYGNKQNNAIIDNYFNVFPDNAAYNFSVVITNDFTGAL